MRQKPDSAEVRTLPGAPRWGIQPLAPGINTCGLVLASQDSRAPRRKGKSVGTPARLGGVTVLARARLVTQVSRTKVEWSCAVYTICLVQKKNFPLQVLRARGVPRLRRKRASNRHAWQWQRPFGGAASKAWKRRTCARKSSCNPPLRTCRRDMDLPAIMFGLQGFALAHGLCPGAELRTTGPGVSTPFHVP